MIERKLLTATQAAVLLGVSRATLNKRIRAGKIPVLTLQREKKPLYLIEEAVLDTLI